MAKYTVEVNDLLKHGFQIFDDSWNTFVPEHKPELCAKIIRYYQFCEIGAETPDRFRFYINEQLARSMPYFNRLYESELWKIEPLYNYIMEEENEQTSMGSDLRDTASRTDGSYIKSFGKSLYHDLHEDTWKTYDETKHMVEGIKGNLTGTHNTDVDGTEDYTKHQDNKLTEHSDRTITENLTSKEVMDDDNTGTTNGNESINVHTNQYSSDTPQGQITQSGVAIDTSYLTNYSHSDESRNRNYSETTKGTDDRTTDFTSDKTTNDTFDRTVTEDNTETMDRDTTSHTDVKDVEDTTKDTDQTQTINSVGHDNTKNLTKDFESTSDNGNDSSVTSNSSYGKSEEASKSKSKRKGVSGVSKITLLNQYRESIINIDEIIIKSLASNFMGVF